MGAATRLLSIICSVTDYDCIPDAAAEQQPFALLAARLPSAIGKTSRCYCEDFGGAVEVWAAL
jgi:hypothetical protein